ncbi:MAG: N-acetylmuramoyl-L-alanine amidase [Muribaculaceae bacterium]|nr:N-acetylmuramoyl-L-alanine amidase [Muribaculaceae bacterium]
MKTIRRGSKGSEVTLLQKMLNIQADGIFGPLTEEAVRDFQQKSRLVVDGIVGPKTWGALGAGGSSSRAVDEIIVHYSATPAGENFTVDQIRQMHLQRGFSDIGYHWYIDLQGEIHAGRSESLAGAHCLGHNTRSIGVCYCGGCPPRSVSGWSSTGLDTRTPAQRDALLRLLRDLRRRYPAATIHGHCEFAAKPCPGFDAAREYADL